MLPNEYLRVTNTFALLVMAGVALLINVSTVFQ